MNKFFLIAVVTIFLVLSCSKPLPEVVSVKGIVTSHTTGQPLANTDVVFQQKKGGTLFNSWIDLETLKTDSSGRFTYSFTPEKEYSYQVTFDKLSYGWTYTMIDPEQTDQTVNVEMTDN